MSVIVCAVCPLQLSELNLASQNLPPYPHEDIPLGDCTCGPILQRYKEELEHVRGELQRRVAELEVVKETLTAFQKEHQGVVEELASHSSKLQSSMQEKRDLLEEVREEGREGGR